MSRDLLKMTADVNRFGISLPAVKDYYLNVIFSSSSRSVVLENGVFVYPWTLQGWRLKLEQTVCRHGKAFVCRKLLIYGPITKKMLKCSGKGGKLRLLNLFFLYKNVLNNKVWVVCSLQSTVPLTSFTDSLFLTCKCPESLNLSTIFISPERFLIFSTSLTHLLLLTLFYFVGPTGFPFSSEDGQTRDRLNYFGFPLNSEPKIYTYNTYYYMYKYILLYIIPQKLCLCLC